MKEPQSVRDVVGEACKVATSTPITITINEEKTSNIPGHHCYTIEIPDAGYSVGTRNAFELLQEVKEARGFYEAWCKETAKKRDEEEKKHYVRLEKEVKVVRDEGEVIRVDGLEQDTKVLLLDFIEGLTIKEVSEILEKNYPCSVWDELHFIREKLRNSLEMQGGQSQ